ncbi:hypothetical protein ACIOJE_14285 [Kitasatospora sp. NPDC087861]|uniref:hypothetical protein n=1 Tax=Kitasatospora sp. NPDC087861 TaxID=3364070 RepID=UPI00382D66E6
MPATRSQPRRPYSGSRRDEVARLAVLHAADDLLAEHGFGALAGSTISRDLVDALVDDLLRPRPN